MFLCFDRKDSFKMVCSIVLLLLPVVVWRIRADENNGWMTRFQNWTSSDIFKRQRYQARCRDSFLGLPNSNRMSKDEGGTCNTKEWASPRTLAQVMAAGHNLFAVTGEEASVGPTPTAALWQHNSWYKAESPGLAQVWHRDHGGEARGSLKRAFLHVLHKTAEPG